MRPSLTSAVRASRGRRESRARLMHPQPRVRKIEGHEQVTTGSPDHSGLPCAIGFNGLFRALPGDRAFLSPSSVRCFGILTNLISASREQDHTTSPSAAVPLVLRHSEASIASRPTFVTMANAPLIEAGWRGLVEMICPTGKAKYFLAKDWTVDSALIGFRKFGFLAQSDAAQPDMTLLSRTRCSVRKARHRAPSTRDDCVADPGPTLGLFHSRGRVVCLTSPGRGCVSRLL